MDNPKMRSTPYMSEDTDKVFELVEELDGLKEKRADLLKKVAELEGVEDQIATKTEEFEKRLGELDEIFGLSPGIPRRLEGLLFMAMSHGRKGTM